MRRPLTLTVRDGKTGADRKLRYEPLEETLVQGRSEDFVVENVTGAIGYQFRTGAEQTKDGRRRVNLFRDDLKSTARFPQNDRAVFILSIHHEGGLRETSHSRREYCGQCRVRL